MRLSTHKAFGKTLLFVYAFITASYPLAHEDFVPLDCYRYLISADSASHPVNSDANDFVCPAHNFAQSTTGTPAVTPRFDSPVSVKFLPSWAEIDHFVEPVHAPSSRAPPLA